MSSLRPPYLPHLGRPRHAAARAPARSPSPQAAGPRSRYRPDPSATLRELPPRFPPRLPAAVAPWNKVLETYVSCMQALSPLSGARKPRFRFRDANTLRSRRSGHAGAARRSSRAGFRPESAARDTRTTHRDYRHLYCCWRIQLANAPKTSGARAQWRACRRHDCAIGCEGIAPPNPCSPLAYCCP